MGCEDDGRIVVGSASQDATFTVQRPGYLPAHELAECMRKIGRLEVENATLKWLADAVGENPTEPCVHEWLTVVLAEDGMVDSFAEFHSDAENRFTHWDRSKLLRHENIGSRIDYVLVDKDFFDNHAQKGLELYNGASPHHHSSAEAAFAAATLGGLMVPVGLSEGPGMPALEKSEFQAQFREAPSSGIVYTAQQLSDHVGVSLLLHGIPVVKCNALSKDAATRLTQPHCRVKRISEFFGIATPSKKRSTAA